MKRRFGWDLGLACLTFTLLPCLPAPAQQVIQLDDGGVMIIGPDGPMAMPGRPARPPGAPGAPDESSPRQQQLQALEFDRRPSTILKAWATPPKDESEAEKSDGSADEPTAPDAPTTAPDESAEPVAAPELTPEQVAAAAAAEAARKQAEEEAARAAAEAKAIEKEMAALQRNVTLGEWSAVAAYFDSLTEDERNAGYKQLLASLQRGPAERPSGPPQGQRYVETNQFDFDDVVALAQFPNVELSKENVDALGGILRAAIAAGHQLEAFLAAITPRLDAEDFVPSRRQLAIMLVAADRPLSLGELVPTVEEAEATDDREGLNLISRYCLAKHQLEKKTTWLEQAWHATQAVLAVGDVDEEAKAEALTRAVDIAPRIREELGQTWLNESFTERPERGMEVLAAIGGAASTALSTQPRESDGRFKLLELQTTAANALLDAAPERAEAWGDELALLAGNWLREALVTYEFDDSTSMGPRMQRDNFGNVFYYDYGGSRRDRDEPEAISTGQVLKIRPSDDWLDRLSDTLRPRFDMVFAQLFLKVSEEAQAFPYIETVAKNLPDQAKSLTDEFLRVWATNHDPNSDQRRTGSYMYFYGFEERANSIPLTRSKQERNLRELGEWVGRLRQLPVELDEDLLARAFMTAHSRAEVYRLETIEGIFGSMDALEPSTLASLLQTMRTNLATVWRDSAAQEAAKTRRRRNDIQAEVLHGYDLARATLDRALAQHTESWELWLARAAIEHDENTYLHEIAKDSEFTARRQEAFTSFHRAAEHYAAAVVDLEQDEERAQVYELWFYAALGACDLPAIDPKMVLAADEIELIRDAIQGLPGERADRHIGMFASTLFTRMSNASPAVKYRYVREGLNITGEHELVAEARQVFDYYEDLVTEIELRASVDGSDRIGHDAPFGLKVDIRHTREIERESGGFSKYLQNQNAQFFAFNYGRPTEDYRDKFEQAAREALREHFEILSITFNDPKAGSRADADYGWRVTPYAYVLLKPRGPQIDRIPPLRLDLDFLDTTGYAVLPVESAAVLVDASQTDGDERPYEACQITQTLDERQAADGKLILEVKATAKGLVPALESLLDVKPAGFREVHRDDQGVSVVKFDEESDAMVSERSWTITLEADEGLPAPPTSFAFPEPRAAVASSELFRYEDADLAPAATTVSLEQAYGRSNRAWLLWVPLVILGLVAAYVGMRLLRRPQVATVDGIQVPDPLTPFTLLGLLRTIEAANGLTTDGQRELNEEINTLERHFFFDDAGDPPDLRGIAERWVRQLS